MNTDTINPVLRIILDYIWMLPWKPISNRSVFSLDEYTFYIEMHDPSRTKDTLPEFHLLPQVKATISGMPPLILHEDPYSLLLMTIWKNHQELFSEITNENAEIGKVTIQEASINKYFQEILLRSLTDWVTNNDRQNGDSFLKEKGFDIRLLAHKDVSGTMCYLLHGYTSKSSGMLVINGNGRFLGRNTPHFHGLLLEYNKNISISSNPEHDQGLNYALDRNLRNYMRKTINNNSRLMKLMVGSHTSFTGHNGLVYLDTFDIYTRSNDETDNWIIIDDKKVITFIDTDEDDCVIRLGVYDAPSYHNANRDLDYMRNQARIIYELARYKSELASGAITDTETRSNVYKQIKEAVGKNRLVIA